MGQINVKGLGVVTIAGDEPTAEETIKIKETLTEKQTNALTENSSAKETDGFLGGMSWGRLVAEAGLAIGGSVLSGGLALPGLAARAGMLARPFLMQLGKSSVASGIGGGAGAAVAQTFDPREDVVKEITRAATEGALAEAIGGPLVIKGAQLVTKRLGGGPKKFNSLLDGAEEAEKVLVSTSDQIIKDPAKYLRLKGTDVTDKNISQLKELAEEMKKGLTPGVKSDNRTLEIIENIVQKSIIGGGGITKRYTAAKEVGDLVARDLVDGMTKLGRDKTEVGELFFNALGKSEDSFRAASDGMYAKVDEALMQKVGTKLSTDTGKIAAIPVDTLGKALAKARGNFFAVPDEIANFTKIFNARIGPTGGKLSFRQLNNFRGDLQSAIGNTFDKKLQSNLKSVVSEIDNIMKPGNLKAVGLNPQAVDALSAANKFFESGMDVFNRGAIRSILKNGANDPNAIDNVFAAVVKTTDKPSLTRKIFNEIDAMAGKTTPAKGRTKAIQAIIDPATSKPILSLKEAADLKSSIRGQYLNQAVAKATTGGQFGSIISAKTFAESLKKTNGTRKILFKEGTKEAADLKSLENTLAFAQGDLSRLPGLPGGIFIQLKQAGAAGQILSLGGFLGGAGAAATFGGLLPAAAILATPAILGRMLLKPSYQSLIFREPVKNAIKATGMSSEEFLKLGTDAQLRIVNSELTQRKIKESAAATYRQIVGRMLTDGYIPKEEHDRVMKEVDAFEEQIKNVKAPLEGEIISEETIPTTSSLNLPNITPSNVGATRINPQAKIALASGNLDGALAANSMGQMKTGGIVSVFKKN